MQDRSLEELRILKRKSELLSELVSSIRTCMKEFLDRPEVQCFDPQEQVSLLMSAFVTINRGYGFDQFEVCSEIKQDELDKIKEIVDMEDKLREE